MRPGAKRLLDQPPTAGTGWCRVLGLDREDRNSLQLAIVDDPDKGARPGGTVQALGQPMVADEVAQLQGFIGHPVARSDERARRFAGKVFAPPLEVQMCTGQARPRLAIVVRLRRAPALMLR